MKTQAPENALRLARYLQLGTQLEAAPPGP